jgi:type IV pilus assembly protein PilE
MRARVATVGGFTLIELMIVVAVIAILAAIVLPSFQNSIRKARRTDARGALTTVAQLLERYNTEKNTYVGASLGNAATDLYKASSENGYYTLAPSNLTASTFTITATPVGGQAADSCGTYSLDQTGTRTPATAGCW